MAASLHHIFNRDISKVEASSASDEKEPTASSVEQRAVEKNCLKMYEQFAKFHHSHGSETTVDPTQPVLHREKTVNFLRKGLTSLSEGYECLDASRPWLVYWIVHSLELLDEFVEDGTEKKAIIEFLARCQNKSGGFGGGPGQISHLAPTYAAVNALSILGGEDALKVIDRTKLMSWLNRLRLDDGSFMMHENDGEVDIRGVYCALSVARLTNVFTPELFHKTAHWVLQCQTYEGGFGGVPGMEAHGGYCFCGLAALVLLDRGHLCDVDRLLRWTCNRQMKLEGGFQGRTNKLVDGCYSFWQGGVFPLLHNLITNEETCPSRWLFNVGALQEYLLICCQDPRGGLVDKPGKSRDYYHTCYTLSGLSVAQNFHGEKVRNQEKQFVLGAKSNLLKPTHPLYNICYDAAALAIAHFDSLPIPSLSKENTETD